MGAQVAADWQSQDIYIGPRLFLARLRARNPYNLFGLKGDRSYDIKDVWYGQPDERYPAPYYVKQPLWKKISGVLGLLALIVVLTRYFSNNPAEQEALAQVQWLVWLSVVVLLAQVVVFWPTAESRAREAERKQRFLSWWHHVRDSGVMTVVLRVPGSGPTLSRGSPPILRRKRGDPPQWSRDLPKGYVLVVLEGLTPEEANRIYAAVLVMHPS